MLSRLVLTGIGRRSQGCARLGDLRPCKPLLPGPRPLPRAGRPAPRLGRRAEAWPAQMGVLAPPTDPGPDPPRSGQGSGVGMIRDGYDEPPSAGARGLAFRSASAALLAFMALLARRSM